jgi:putative membrane protein
MRDDMAVEDDRIDYRFSLANERTFLAWIRTAVALLAGGIVAVKALNFDHDALRWIVAVPPIVGGGALAIFATVRWRRYDDAMRGGRELPVGSGIVVLGVALGVYALVVLAAAILD